MTGTSVSSPTPARVASRGLVRYVVAATLARTVDGGGVLAVVLLVTHSGGPGWLAGLLGACITAPHLLGPLIARSLDIARDSRVVLAAACLVHGAALAAGVLLYPVTGPGFTAVLLTICGLTGPLLTGGISSRLPSIAGPAQKSQRRAQAWDVATYGLGGTIGPSIVAAVSGLVGPTWAGVGLGSAAVLAAVVVRLLPPQPAPLDPAAVPRPIKALTMMASQPRLLRTLVLTIAVALSVAALPITAVASAPALHFTPALAGVLTGGYGAGGLVASAILMIVPLRGSPDRLMAGLSIGVALGLTTALVAPNFWLAIPAYALTGALNSFFFAATLAARNEYSTPEIRSQVFVWVGALKITAGSAGTAVAGAIVATDLHVPILLAIVVVTAAAAFSVVTQVVGRIRKK